MSSCNDFVSLHAHSSASDGLGRVEEILRYAAEVGNLGHAIVDHGVVGGTFTAWREAPKIAAEWGRPFRAIGGCEIYLVDNRWEPPKRAPRKAAGLAAEAEEGAGTVVERVMPSRTHLTLLVATEEGFSNMMRIIQEANKSGMPGGWGKWMPLCDLKLLAKHHAGLICLSGCPLALIASLVLNNRREEAIQTVRDLRQIFGDRLILEVMPGEFSDQRPVNHFCLEMAESLKIPVVATNDTHWMKPEDWETHEVLLAIQYKQKMADPTRREGGKRFCLEDRCYDLKNRAGMESAFQQVHGDYLSRSVVQGMLDQTLAIAEQVTFTGPKFAAALPELSLAEDAARWERFQAWRKVHGVRERVNHSHQYHAGE